jgi:DHA1 family bicyclomycin/chloramphenicol resistance-like MFS transporter
MLFMFLLWGRGIFAVMAALFLLVLSAGIVMAASFSLAMQNQANNAGSAAALLGLTPLLFGGVVSPAVGIGGGESGLPMGTVIFLATLAALLCFVLLVRRKPEHSDGG